MSGTDPKEKAVGDLALELVGDIKDHPDLGDALQEIYQLVASGKPADVDTARIKLVEAVKVVAPEMAGYLDRQIENLAGGTKPRFH